MLVNPCTTRETDVDGPHENDDTWKVEGRVAHTLLSFEAVPKDVLPRSNCRTHGTKFCYHCASTTIGSKYTLFLDDEALGRTEVGPSRVMV